jgi:hypothetical protein
MTRLLSDVLHERADSAPGPHVDLDAIIGAGNRRVRRSRLSTGLAAAAVATVVAGSSLVLPGLVAQERDAPVAGAPAPFTERRAGYALDGAIHWGDETFEVGLPVTSYVQTDDGFVLTNRQGDVFLFDGTDSQRIGFTSNGRIRADDTGSLVAWVDRAEDGHPQYVVYDTRTMAEVARVDDVAAGPSREEWDLAAEVFAVDDAVPPTGGTASTGSCGTTWPPATPLFWPRRIRRPTRPRRSRSPTQSRTSPTAGSPTWSTPGRAPR